MKQKFLFTLLTCMIAVTGVFAQGQKFGYVNADSVLQAHPKFENQKKVLETYGKQLQTTLQDKEKELQAKIADYQQNAAGWIPDVLQEKEKEIQRLQQEYQQFNVSANQKLGMKEQELLSPLSADIEKAIQSVAKEKGFDFILRQELFLFSNPVYDITGDVITKVKQAASASNN
ncbi:OmpH family outer membrane protein [Rapidithrix thailandica]|uniref:OmpH family outer membrane protein n=1 Tax=Rapidithrix thailandica TaxID=413964 RepID=A0AAW9S425_9BACT